MQRKVIIMGAGGRDFHNFNTRYRWNHDYKVVAFTATQIPNIEGRAYPAELAGEGYARGIPIEPESRLQELIREHGVDEVVFAYSDVPHEYVMHRASAVMAAGASFVLLGPRDTMIESKLPVIAVTAVRTGAGKSQTTRRLAAILRERGLRVVVIRHPMPYGDLRRQRVQRFAELADLDRHDCTIEEREEYEPHITRGTVVYAGVDYGAILEEAEAEADAILWDGGNNDFSFYKPRLTVVVADPHRAGHEITYHPGETNLRLADVVVINKVGTADRSDIDTLRSNIQDCNPSAAIVEAESPVTADDAAAIQGKRVLVVEDGPTLTHGGMTFGAGVLAAKKYGAAEVIDPRPYAVGSIADTLRRYPSLGPLLPAMGYGEEQMNELGESIAKTPADVVVVGTPIDIRRLLDLDKPAVRVRYELEEKTKPDLAEAVDAIL
jgi:predicted GTPase